MNEKEPLKISNINLDNIIYTSIKENRRKKIVYIKYKNKKNNVSNFVFQTPTLLNVNRAKLHNNYYELDIPIKTKKINKEPYFIKFLNNLDNKILYDASNYSSSWFQNIGTENILYQKIIRSSTNEIYKNGIINLKILNTSSFNTIIKNEEKIIKPNEIEENTWVKMILECYGIIISENGFSLFLRPIIMYFKKIKISNYNYKFIEESDNSDDENEIEELESSNIFIKKDVEKLENDKYSETSSESE